HTRFSRDWSSDVCSSDLYGWKLLLTNRLFVATKWVRYPKPRKICPAALTNVLWLNTTLDGAKLRNLYCIPAFWTWVVFSTQTLSVGTPTASYTPPFRREG